MTKETDQQFELRKQKLSEVKKKGVNPYPAVYEGRINASSALEKSEGERVKVAGRLMSKREMGKSAFSHIKDSTGQIQVYVRQDKIGEESFDFFKTVDIGDFIGAEGELFVTRTGEKTVLAGSFELLSKSLRPLPEKWHGLKDVEIRYRKRYLDILTNPESSKALKARTFVISEIRRELLEKDYIEVETPILQTVAGGAAARPFRTFHNTYDIDLFLRIAPELYLKRLLVGGWDRVYEIGRNFRNEGISVRHNPEFTMLEVYCAYTDYRYMMELSKKMIIGAARKLKEAGYSVPEYIFRGWEEKNLWELMSEHTGLKFSYDDSFDEIRKKADRLKVPPGKDSHQKVVDRIFTNFVQDKLVEPTFVTGFLSKHSPLAKRSSENQEIAERFEIFIGGQEIGNAYSEQNDPEIQREMFELQAEGPEDEETCRQVDYDFLEALEYGMPPASGLGIGIDRLVILLSGSESIREVILFPMLKPVKDS